MMGRSGYDASLLPSLSALTAPAIAPRAAESEVLMQVMRNLAAKIRKWLGLDRKPVGEPQGTA